MLRGLAEADVPAEFTFHTSAERARELEAELKQRGHALEAREPSGLLPLVAGALAVRHTGLPRRTWLAAWPTVLALLAVSILATHPALNINLVHEPWGSLKGVLPGAWPCACSTAPRRWASSSRPNGCSSGSGAPARSSPPTW